MIVGRVAGAKASRRHKVAVWRSMMEVHAAVLKEIEADLANKHGLSLNEFDALINVPAAGIGFRELTDRVILSQSALSRLVDRLEVRGLVVRIGAEGDSRAVDVDLTEEGKKLVRNAARTNAAAVERAFADRLSGEELEYLYEVFSRLLGGPVEV
ncbi:DNA-binding transcriptional regulator, MarR family [Saccharopolyspora kobensis]|uniref:DNA-binding transcriptional regulator, MarR family n=1 Tax=Saccharopolyspora kobensis TaxID=146035 RepID=A0A1H5W3Q6_9PSEU|nr:DNA-binding transcriptional regulator, MarR family [Saccharopolyspora kobensis]SFD71590.1 DNA-binding transcriptional regulator, MarR family [Saccharopolyspora kobensis]